jgi:hypothetical protein
VGNSVILAAKKSDTVMKTFHKYGLRITRTELSELSTKLFAALKNYIRQEENIGSFYLTVAYSSIQ